MEKKHECDCGCEEELNIEENVMVLTDDDGNQVEFELLDVIEKDDKEYVILLPVEQTEEEEGSVVVLKVEESENEDVEAFVSIDNEEEAEEIFKMFKDKHKDEYEFND